MHERGRDAMLGAWGRFVASRPRVTLLVCGLLMVVSLYLTLTRLEFRSDRSELVDPDLSWNRAYTEYKERFDRWDDVIVCLDGDPDDARVDALARRIADSIRADDRVREADAGFDVSETGPRLFAAAPAPLFDETLDHIAGARPIAAAPHATAALTMALGQLEADPSRTESLDELEMINSVAEGLRQNLDGDIPFQLGLPALINRSHAATPQHRADLVLRQQGVQFLDGGGRPVGGGVLVRIAHQERERKSPANERWSFLCSENSFLRVGASREDGPAIRRYRRAVEFARRANHTRETMPLPKGVGGVNSLYGGVLA
jgi:hypothetical protein